MHDTDNIAAVRRMQNYIDAHILQPITLRQLADAAGYSPWHSARLFRELTGRTPFAYIRSLRLSQAALVLRDGAPRVIDVALDFLFDSHEGFTRAFTREFGISPHKYSQNPIPIRLFLPYDAVTVGNIKNEEEFKMNQKTLLIFTQVIERPARRMLLRRGIKATEYFEYCSEVSCGTWDTLCGIKEALYEPVGAWLPASMILPGTSMYVHGVEVPTDWAGEVPEGFEVIELAPCTMMVFQGPRYNDENYQEEVGKVMDAIDEYDPTLYGYEWAPDDAPRMQLAPMGRRGYIEMRPVRPIAR